MPELPDVERFRRFFVRHAAGKTVKSVTADPTIVRNATPGGLNRALRGRRLEEPDRHGKWLVCWTDGPVLLLHFGMTGHFVWSGDQDPHRHDRLVLKLREGGELRYRNMRKLGGVWLAHSPEDVPAVLGPLGPDALDVKRRQFMGLLERRRGGIKAALMDQRLIAGVGNLVADETLWRARLNPTRDMRSLEAWERDRLYDEMRGVLREWTRRATAPSGTLLSVRDQPEARCPRCGTRLERMKAAGRTTYFCPACQAPAARSL